MKSQKPARSGLQYLADAGYSEAMGLSIINSTQWSKVTGNNDFEGVRINNTSNVQLDLMRPDPLSTALEIVMYNQSRQQHSFKMFEYGTVYNKSNGSYIENNFISLIWNRQPCGMSLGLLLPMRNIESIFT
jgi:phenylalanyl-tRNA synthetase beta chain